MKICPSSCFKIAKRLFVWDLFNVTALSSLVTRKVASLFWKTTTYRPIFSVIFFRPWWNQTFLALHFSRSVPVLGNSNCLYTAGSSVTVYTRKSMHVNMSWLLHRLRSYKEHKGWHDCCHILPLWALPVSLFCTHSRLGQFGTGMWCVHSLGGNTVSSNPLLF